MRKSKREKEREREEAKRREEESLAAKTYAEFLDAFEGEGASRKGSGFVRASGSARDADTAASEYNPRGRGKIDVGTRAFADDTTVSGNTERVKEQCPDSPDSVRLLHLQLQNQKENEPWMTSLKS